MLSLESQCFFKICFCFILLQSKSVVTDSLGNSEFGFPRISMFFSGPVIKCFRYISRLDNKMSTVIGSFLVTRP